MARRGNGEGSVYRNVRTGGWTAAATVGWEGGKPIRKRKSVKTKAEGRAWIAEVTKAVRDGLAPPDDRLKVGEWLDIWLGDIQAKVTSGTRDAYADRVRLYVQPYLGDTRLRSLTPRHVDAWLRQLEDQGLAPATQRAAYRVLGRALKVAQQHGLVDRNVAAIADGPKSDGRAARWATPGEMQRLVTGVLDDEHRASNGRAGQKPRYGYAVVVACCTGLRRGELLGLRWDDVDLDARRLVVRQQVQRARSRGLVICPPKTARSSRYVPLSKLAVEALRRQADEQRRERDAAGAKWRDEGLVFTTAVGGRVDPRAFARSLASIAARLDVDHVNPHALRHGAATLLLDQGEDLGKTADVLGHSTPRTTKEVYAHVVPGQLDSAADAIDRALGCVA